MPGDEHVHAGAPGVWYTVRPDTEMAAVLRLAAGLDDPITIDAAQRDLLRRAYTGMWPGAADAPMLVTAPAPQATDASASPTVDVPRRVPHAPDRRDPAGSADT